MPFESYDEQLVCTITPTPFVDLMKDYCEARNDNPFRASILESENYKLRYYYEELGADLIRAKSYKEAELKRAIVAKEKDGEVGDELRSLFPDVKILSRKEIKSTIQGVYDRLGVAKTAKATDLLNYGFKLKECKTKDRKSGFVVET